MEIDRDYNTESSVENKLISFDKDLKINKKEENYNYNNINNNNSYAINTSKHANKSSEAEIENFLKSMQNRSKYDKD